MHEVAPGGTDSAIAWFSAAPLAPSRSVNVRPRARPRSLKDLANRSDVISRFSATPTGSFANGFEMGFAPGVARGVAVNSAKPTKRFAPGLGDQRRDLPVEVDEGHQSY